MLLKQNLTTASKLQSWRSFLVNSYDPVQALLNGKHITINPAEGSNLFIHDYGDFVPAEGVIIVGIENPENFRQIEKQRYLFSGLQPLFVSRYPQSNDLVKWLASIPNRYLHFGDVDFAGINIYQTEFRKKLGKKATFFLPPNTEQLLLQYGNKALFNRQYKPLINLQDEENEPAVNAAFQLLLKHKRALEQEVFIGRQ